MPRALFLLLICCLLAGCSGNASDGQANEFRVDCPDPSADTAGLDPDRQGLASLSGKALALVFRLQPELAEGLEPRALVRLSTPAQLSRWVTGFSGEVPKRLDVHVRRRAVLGVKDNNATVLLEVTAAGRASSALHDVFQVELVRGVNGWLVDEVRACSDVAGALETDAEFVSVTCVAQEFVRLARSSSPDWKQQIAAMKLISTGDAVASDIDVLARLKRSLGDAEYPAIATPLAAGVTRASADSAEVLVVIQRDPLGPDADGGVDWVPVQLARVESGWKVTSYD